MKWCSCATLMIAVAGLGLAMPVWAQQVGRPPSPVKAVPTKYNDPGAVTAQLQSSDNFQTQRAVEAALQMLGDANRGTKATDQLPNWLKLLLGQKRFDEVEEIALAGILTHPDSLAMVERCQEFRVRASLAGGKPKEALALAKGLYNVSSMPGTSHAIDLVSECLYDLNKDAGPAAIVKKYKLQQIHGAAMPANGQPAADVEKLLLADVRVDPKAYQEAIAAADLSEDGFIGLMTKGNLLLLADQPKDAKKVFEKAYALATDKSLALATEGMARAMRAEDGTVGRANAWVLSLRPQDAGQ